MKSIIIDRIKKGQFVLIAEAGVNYYDIAIKEGITPMEAAKLMVKKASEAGIHAIKFQSYKANTLASKDSPSYWDTNEESTTSQYELFKKFDLFGAEEYKELAEYSEKQGIEFLSTAFDIESADYLYNLMNVYKISSSDLNNLSFVEYQAKKNKPIILSAGASELSEIKKTIEVIRKHNQELIVLMHCVLEYPTPYDHANLNKIASLKKEFPNLVMGYSDHTKPDPGYNVLSTAYNLGATVIEKHYTLDKTLKGNDHYHAMDDQDATKILDVIGFVESIRGSYEIRCLDTEKTARLNARRSLVAAVDIPEGSVITKEMLTYKRPGTGISASKFDEIVGARANVLIKEDTVIQMNMISVKDCP